MAGGGVINIIISCEKITHFTSCSSPRTFICRKCFFEESEGWGMSYVTSASLNHSSSFRKTLKISEYTFTAELSSIPKLNAKQQLIGFAGLKSEDLNKSPFFGGIITTGFLILYGASWTPSIKVNDTKPSDIRVHYLK